MTRGPARASRSRGHGRSRQAGDCTCVGVPVPLMPFVTGLAGESFPRFHHEPDRPSRRGRFRPSPLSRPFRPAGAFTVIPTDCSLYCHSCRLESFLSFRPTGGSGEIRITFRAWTPGRIPGGEKFFPEALRPAMRPYPLNDSRFRTVPRSLGGVRPKKNEKKVRKNLEGKKKAVPLQSRSGNGTARGDGTRVFRVTEEDH